MFRDCDDHNSRIAPCFALIQCAHGRFGGCHLSAYQLSAPRIRICPGRRCVLISFLPIGGLTPCGALSRPWPRPLAPPPPRAENSTACVQMPILDGSGQVWVENIAGAGLRPAHKPGTPDLLERKQAWRPNVPISVFDHDSFVTLYPAGFYRRITAGVEFQDVPVIGSQWISFEAQAADNPVRPFATDFAPARTWVSSPEYAYAMREAGYLKAGTPDCVLVADQDAWRESALLAKRWPHAATPSAAAALHSAPSAAAMPIQTAPVTTLG